MTTVRSEITTKMAWKHDGARKIFGVEAGSKNLSAIAPIVSNEPEICPCCVSLGDWAFTVQEGRYTAAVLAKIHHNISTICM